MFYVVLNEEVLPEGHDTERQAHDAGQEIVRKLREKDEPATYVVAELPALS